MADFTDETTVRDKFQLTDTTLVPTSLVTQSIDDAHTEIMRYLDPVFDVQPGADGLILGETLLAGAHLLRSLASKEAFSQKRVAVGSTRIETGPRYKFLADEAEGSEARAWASLEEFLLELPPRVLIKASATTPVLGEE